MTFTKPIINISQEVEKPKYDHGFTDSQVQDILYKKELLDKRDILSNPITREEFKTIVIPWLRIYRTEQFILNEAKIKPPKVPKPPKEKKLTKTQIKKKLNECIFKLACGETLDEEELKFYDEYKEGLQL